MSPSSPHIADSIAGYTLIERIGAGGYGEVWKAEAPGGLAKAVKLVYGYFDDQRAACERKALHRIKEARHPFLLSLERIEIVDGQLVVVTELADMSLKERFEKCRSEGKPGIPRDELLVYVADAADALDYMRESHGLQHLDVKPENLLITSGRVKVADFGLVKSLEDEHVSLLGGLTPQYAPPELFDGSPSHSSDQYSLAIVYQEMLTGTPPFPGRTAAQLANQHLHSQPQLNPLPPPDRVVVARALAKKPSDRFPSCRGMVDSLAAASPHRAGSTAPKAVENSEPQSPSTDTSSLRDKETHPAPHSHSGGHAMPQPRAMQTLVLGDAVADDEDSLEPCLQPLELPPPAEPVRLPPLQVSAAEEQNLVPSLVLGIGGTAADVLRDLRKRILRDEKSFSQGNLEFLLLDTDSATIDSACGDRCEDSLEFRETLHLPLRSSADYREQSTDHLQWLSRRWLYNIPRSLRTEGRRPLGRLAFADQAQRVKKRIREALVATADKIKLGQPGTGAPRKQLRVVIVAAIGGGTGGGIVADMGYLVRQALEELAYSSHEICAVLTHGTGANPDQQDLAIANGYSCLSEVEHYTLTGYPGDPSCGLAPSDRPAFDHTYLVHLGDDLEKRSHAAAVAKVAEYLYLNVASPVGEFFDAARQETVLPDLASRRHTPVRTFGLIQFDPHHNEITSLAVEELSRCVVSEWLGGDKFFQEQTVDAYLEAEFPELQELSEKERKRRKKKRFESSAGAEHKTGLQYLLDREALHDVLVSAIEQQLGGKGAHVFRKWIQLASTRGLGDKRAFLRELDRSLGPRRRPGDDTTAPLSELEHSLAAASADLAVMAVESIRDVLMRLTSNPQARVAGAQQAAQWLCDRLRQFERATSTEWTRIEERLTALEKSLPEKVTARGNGFWGRKNRGETWSDYCYLRSHIIVVESVARFVRRVNTHLSDYREQLKNTQFSLSRVASQFGSQRVWLDAIASSHADDSETRSLSQSIGRLIESHMSEMVEQLDGALGDELIRLESSSADAKEPPNVHRFARGLRAKSWAVLSGALRELDLPNRMFSADADSVGNISEFLPEAVPQLPKSGGGKRLLVVAPRTAGEETVRAGLCHCEEGQFSLVRAGQSELALCYEVQDLSLPMVAARLVEHRENCILAAGRLHTRLDVPWPERMNWQ